MRSIAGASTLGICKHRRARCRRLSVCLAALVVLGLAGCSTVPDWSPRESRELSITVYYDGSAGPRTVPLPTSTQDVMILELRSEPSDLQQTFSASDRQLHLPGGSSRARVHCRYRLFRRRAADGTALPWISVEELFPGAKRITDDDVEDAEGAEGAEGASRPGAPPRVDLNDPLDSRDPLGAPHGP